MQVKTQFPIPSHPLRCYKPKVGKWRVDKDAEKLEPSYVASGNVILWSHFGKQFRICFKMKHKLLKRANTSISMNLHKENKNICSWKTCMWMFTVVLFITKKDEDSFKVLHITSGWKI